ncbi:MAG TPA: response regulator [Methylomirabilota bacterium]
MSETTGARVLIVDDDAASRRLLDVRLRALECEVSQAGNGHEALAAVQRQAPSLMLLDVEMPGMDGFELLRTLRGAGVFPSWS